MRRFLIIAALALGLCHPAKATTPPPGYERDVSALLQNYAAQGRFSGMVLVAKDGRPVFRHAVGLANREWNVPVTPNTRFRIGSITKQFTAAAILKLADEGKLSLDDPISKYDPAAPPPWTGITLKHLLTHTSGIPSYTGLKTFFFETSRIDRPPSQIVDLTRAMPLEFKPGEKWAYDNTGYILLGVVIEKVTGQSYANYLKAAFFDPLGMKDTGYDLGETLIERRADGYAMLNATVINAPYLAMSLPHAAGSLYSSADDLLAWDQALHAGKVISRASVAAMFTNYGFKYGYGQFVDKVEGRRFWSHAGGINGFHTMLARYPDDNLTLIVLSNFQNADVGRITWRLGELYFDPKSAEGPAGPPTIAELDRYVGRYLASGDAWTVSRDGPRLYMQEGEKPKVEMFRELGRAFFVKFPSNGYAFGPGEQAGEIRFWRKGELVAAKRAAE